MLRKLVLETLKAEYKSGMTQEKIAQKHNVSHVVINRLLAGTRDAGGLTLNTVCRMFPNMVVSLKGDSRIGNSNIITNSRVQSDNFFTHSGGEDAGINCELAIAMTQGMTPEEKARFLKELNK